MYLDLEVALKPGNFPGVLHIPPQTNLHHLCNRAHCALGPARRHVVHHFAAPAVGGQKASRHRGHRGAHCLAEHERLLLLTGAVCLVP